nr:hypothetical protein [uncultured Dialister sp.]
MIKKRKALCAALALLFSGFTICMGNSASADDLSEIIVKADRDGKVVELPGGLVNETAKLGILGNQTIYDIPYTETSMTKKTLETFADPSQPLANVLQNDPSILDSRIT